MTFQGLTWDSLGSPGKLKRSWHPQHDTTLRISFVTIPPKKKMKDAFALELWVRVDGSCRGHCCDLRSRLILRANHPPDSPLAIVVIHTHCRPTSKPPSDGDEAWVCWLIGWLVALYTANHQGHCSHASLMMLMAPATWLFPSIAWVSFIENDLKGRYFSASMSVEERLGSFLSFQKCQQHSTTKNNNTAIESSLHFGSAFSLSLVEPPSFLKMSLKWQKI